jgi:hypothetical protein
MSVFFIFGDSLTSFPLADRLNRSGGKPPWVGEKL